jgi:hypothetical protein
MTATTSTTTTPANDTANAVAQPQNLGTPSMGIQESKSGADLSSDQSEDISGKEVEDAGPSLAITLLLTTGSRHPFTIDGKYLRKQSVNVENDDPFAMSVYTLKELIWREWRSGEFVQLWDKKRTDVNCGCRLGNPSFVAELHPSDLIWKVVR